MSRIFLAISAIGLSSCSIGVIDKTALLVASVKGRRARKSPTWATLAGYEQMFESITAGNGNEFCTYLKATGGIVQSFSAFSEARKIYGALLIKLKNSSEARREKSALAEEGRKTFVKTSKASLALFSVYSAVAAEAVPIHHRAVVLASLAKFTKRWDAVIALGKSVHYEDPTERSQLGVSFRDFMGVQEETRYLLHRFLDEKMHSWLPENSNPRLFSWLINCYFRLHVKILQVISGMRRGGIVDPNSLLVPLTLENALFLSIPIIKPDTHSILYAETIVARQKFIDQWKEMAEAGEVNSRAGVLFHLHLKLIKAAMTWYRS